MLDLSSEAAASGKLLLVLSGFVADLCEGRVLREHRDLDTVVLEADLPFWRDALTKRGFTIGSFRSKDPQYAFPAEKEGVSIDVGGIHITDTEVWDRTTPNERYIWRIHPRELIWQREIAGTTVRFISPQIAAIFKAESGRGLEKDVGDLEMLKRYL